MHKNAAGHTREGVIQQIKDGEESIHNYVFYIPIGKAPEKIRQWRSQGHEIIYLTSRQKKDEIKQIKQILVKEFGGIDTVEI